MRVTQLFKNHKLKFGFTLLLILLEAGIAILFPLFIGFAIDDAIDGERNGAIYLGLLGLSALVVGVGRRLFDSRFYAAIFQNLGTEILTNSKSDQPSVKAARLSMIRELVEFLENSLPMLINNIIGLVGVIVIIATINLKVFLGCLIATVLIGIVYLISSKKTIRLNKAYNDEIEKQVDEISRNNMADLSAHLKKLMSWNIKLSDLEATNFSFSWIVLIVFLVLAILLPIEDGLIQYGALFALVMYAFQYMENVINLPLFYQNWLRLEEIKERLEN